MKKILLKASFIKSLFFASVACIGIGRAWQHLYFDAPYREILWDESIMAPVISKLTNLKWSDYAANPDTDGLIQQWIRQIGWLLIIMTIWSGIRTWLDRNHSQLFRFTDKLVFFMMSGIMGILGFLYSKSMFYHIGQFLEFSIQITTPLFLYYFLKNGMTLRLEMAIKIALALTFGSHGLYAIGYYPIPGDFVEMTINILQCTESQAKSFLLIVGYIDLVAAVLIFLKGRWRSYALYYMIFWGLCTAIARLAGHWHQGFEAEAISNYWFQVLYRLPHALIPLALMVHYAEKNVTLKFPLQQRH